MLTDPGVVNNAEVGELGEVTLESMLDTSDAEVVQLGNEAENESQDSSVIDLPGKKRIIILPRHVRDKGE